MWLLRLPLPADQRLPLPEGRHLLPWHFDAGETSRLADMLAGLLAGVERHLILPWPAVRLLASSTSTLARNDTLLVITIDALAVADAEIDEVLGRITCAYAMLQFPRPQESGYGWQERFLKPTLMTLVHEEIGAEEHPLAPLNIAALPVRLAASLTTDVLSLVELLGATIEHRLAHATEGTTAADYEASLHGAAGQRIGKRLLRLPVYERNAAVEVLKRAGAGTWSDERFRVGAKALEEVGLARVVGGSVSLDPLARRAKAPPIFRAWNELLPRRLPPEPARRWGLEAAPDEGTPAMDPPSGAPGIAGAAPGIAAGLAFTRSAVQAPPGSHEGIERIRKWIRDGGDFKERCRRAQDFLSDPERFRVVGTDHRSEYGLWHEVIRCQFTEDEWKRINFIHRDDLQYDEMVDDKARRFAMSASGHPDSRATFRGFQVLDRKRFSSRDSLPRQIDAFLERRRDLMLDLARWMAFAFREKLVSDNKPVFTGLLSWLWKSVVEDDVKRQDLRSEAHQVVRACLALALKNGYAREQVRIQEDARTIGLDVSGVSAAGEHPSDFLQQMKTGFTAMLDGAFREARLAYQQAGGIAKSRGDVFDEWVALHGEEDAALASIRFGDRATEESRALEDDYRRRRLALEQSAKVAAWIEQGRRHRDRITEMVIERLLKENRRRSISERSMSWSTQPHEYWTMFRDLETIHAPPNLQQVYVQPLVDLGTFDPEQELRYRLQLGVDKTEKTKEWLSRIIGDRRANLGDARTRDESLLKELTRAGTFKRERLQRLEAFPKIADILRTDDLDWALAFFSQCEEDLKDERLGNPHGYIEALFRYADVDLRIVVLDRLEAVVDGPKSVRWRWEIARSMRHELPLEQLVGLHEDAAERLVRLVLDLVRGGQEHDALSSDEDLAWALFSIFQGVSRFRRPIPSALQDEVRAWAGRLLQKKLPDKRQDLQGVFSAATHLAYVVAPDDEARADVVRGALATAEISAPESGKGFAHGGPLGAWISLTEAGVSVTSALMAEAADKLWAKLDGAWEETLRLAKSDPRQAWPYVGFLARWIASEKANPVPVVRERLLLLVQVAQEQLSLCADLLNPKFWDDKWHIFVDFVWQFAGGGGDGRDPVSARMGVVDLLSRWAAPLTRSSRELPADLGFLVDLTLAAMLDESPAVANHAAYAITGYAVHARSAADVRRVAGGLRRMAIDPRLGVRGAAAYAGTRLPQLDVADDIRAVALKIDEELAADPYAVIQRQRSFGELDGKFPHL